MKTKIKTEGISYKKVSGNSLILIFFVIGYWWVMDVALAKLETGLSGKRLLKMSMWESCNRSAMERSWSFKRDCGVRICQWIGFGGWIKDKSMII